jgi:hypothetical protein
VSCEITRWLCQGFGSATVEQELYFGWLAAQRFLGSIRTGGDKGSLRFADLSGAPAILQSSSTTLLTPQEARRLIGQYVTSLQGPAARRHRIRRAARDAGGPTTPDLAARDRKLDAPRLAAPIPPPAG